MTSKIVVCFCNNDFLSKVIIEQILLQGFCVRVCSIEPFCENSLRVVAKLGQISFHVVDPLNYHGVLHILHGADYVINFITLAHTVNMSKVSNFAKLIQESAKNIASVVAQVGISKLIHLSNIVFGVENSYTKAVLEAERIILSIVRNSTILKFDFIFGENDFLLCKFGKLLSIMPFFPVFGNGKAIISPIYVGDVALSILNCLTSNSESEISKGVFKLSGISNFTILELYKIIADSLEKRVTFFKLPFSFFRMECFFSSMKLFYIFSYIIFGRFGPFFNMSEYPLFKNNIHIEGAKENSISLFVPRPTLLESKIEGILTPFKNH